MNNVKHDDVSKNALLFKITLWLPTILYKYMFSIVFNSFRRPFSVIPKHCMCFVFRLFEMRCIKIMDKMYNDYTKQAVDSMDDEAIIWGVKSSPLSIAYENFMYDVVGHTCSRKLMNKQWYNDLPPNVRPFCKVNLMK